MARSRERANGEARPYFDKSKGLWYGRVKMLDGRWKKTAGCATEYLAEQALADLRKTRDANLPVGNRRQTLRGYADRWLANKHTIQPPTRERYQQYLDLYINEELGHRKLIELTPAHVRAFVDKLERADYAPNTVSAILGVLHQILAAATTEEIVARNVAAAIRPSRPRERRRDPVVLDGDQVAAFLAAAAGDPFEALWVLAVYTGARIGELLGLTWDAIDLDAGTLTIHRTLRYAERQLALSDRPKGRKKRSRELVLPAEVVEVLRRHRLRQHATRLESGAAWHDQGLVFPNQTGGPLWRSVVAETSLVAILRKAGLPYAEPGKAAEQVHVTPHALRHSFATLMLAEHPDDLLWVSRQLGHASVKITADLYTSTQKAPLKRLAGRASKLFRLAHQPASLGFQQAGESPSTPPPATPGDQDRQSG